MVADGDVGLDLVDLVQFAQPVGAEAALRRAVRQAAGDDVAHVVGVLRAVLGVARVDVVDQALVQRPGVDPALPVVDDGVAEAVGLALLVGHAGGAPGAPGGVERGGAGLGQQPIDRGLQVARGMQRVLVGGVRDVGVGVEHLADGGLRRARRQDGQAQAQDFQALLHGVSSMFSGWGWLARASRRKSLAGGGEGGTGASPRGEVSSEDWGEPCAPPFRRNFPPVQNSQLCTANSPRTRDWTSSSSTHFQPAESSRPRSKT